VAKRETLRRNASPFRTPAEPWYCFVSHFLFGGSAEPFEFGVALLHSYWYEEAEKQFEAIAAIDPGCAMAYWGQAMTLHRSAYSQPSVQDLKRGWELVQKA
jgi:hypothetical protein